MKRYHALASPAVAERVVRAGHLFVGLGVIEKLLPLGDNEVGFSADQFRGARLDPLGPFGGLAHDQHRLSERGRLFLHLAAVP